MLLVPFALLLAAAAAHVYPIAQRTELFLVPAVTLLIAEGIAQLVRWAPARGRTLTALLLAGVVAAGPVSLAGSGLVHPRTREEIKPVLEFVRNHWRPGDTLYVHDGAQYAFLYYEECACVRLTSAEGRTLWPAVPAPGGRAQYSPAIDSKSPALLIGPYEGNNWSRYLTDVRRVTVRHRVWFLYTHVRTAQERSFIERGLIGYLDRIGTRVQAIDRSGAHAYLYLFARNPDVGTRTRSRPRAQDTGLRSFRNSCCTLR
jgi:hypothetical protein